MTPACPSPLELERAFWSGDAQVSEHARSCARCEGELDEIGMMAKLGQSLGPAPVSGERREELRATILSRLERPVVAPSRVRWPFAAIPLAAAAAALLVWWLLPSSQHVRTVALDRRSTVLDHEGARYLVASLQPDEVVRLVEGQISLRVDPLHAGEHFRVVAGDAEIESRGGAFDVSARGDALVSVRAISGDVEIRGSSERRTLRAGETWTLTPPSAAAAAPAATEPATVAHSPKAVTDSAPPVIRHPSPSTRSETETVAETVAETETVAEPETEITLNPPTPAMRAFDDGWRGMRASDFRAAAAAFDRAVLSDESGPLAEDARFWRATALARGNHVADAIVAFTAFLDRHPRAVRAAEASAMLGWLLLDRGKPGDLDRAATLFTAATRDPSARVRDSAVRGLRAVGAAAAP